MKAFIIVQLSLVLCRKENDKLISNNFLNSLLSIAKSLKLTVQQTMPKVTPDLFTVLHDTAATNTLIKLYKAALKQIPQVLLHFLPKAFAMLGKGIAWKTKDEAYFDDKYIPIHPAQGSFLYLQARALNAKNIFEFGTSYGISTIYLAKAAKDNGGKVVTTEYLPHKVKAAVQNLKEAELNEYVDIIEGDARETLKNNQTSFDFVLLDGWPDLVFSVFKLIEPKLKKGAVIIIDDVDGFQPSMQDYLDYVRNPANGYLSDTIKLKKAVEYTIKVN